MKCTFYLRMYKNVNIVFLRFFSGIIIYLHATSGDGTSWCDTISPPNHTPERNPETGIEIIISITETCAIGILPWDFLGHLKYDFICKIVKTVLT